MVLCGSNSASAMYDQICTLCSSHASYGYLFVQSDEKRLGETCGLAAVSRWFSYLKVEIEAGSLRLTFEF